MVKLFEDLESMLGSVKRVVDHCLTDAKLFDHSMNGSEPPGVIFGEHMQGALGLHEGPWYMEPTKLIPEEFQK